MKSIRAILTKLFYILFRSTSYSIFRELRKNQYNSWNDIVDKQWQDIIEILEYAYRNVPYYSDLFKEIGIVENNHVTLKTKEDYNKIPVLTKEVIRKEGKRMYAKGYLSKKPFENTSGGSTGAPSIFLQDQYYTNYGEGNMLLFKSWRVKNVFSETVYLWGANRDIGTSLKKKLAYLIRNVKFFSSSKMSNNQKLEFINYINKKRPEMIVAYAQSIFEIAKFAEESDIKIVPQKVIHTGAGMLFDHMRLKIELQFGCKVYNHYGSREVSSIASECSAHDGLHLFPEWNFVEIVNENGNPSPDGEQGQVVITTLKNYSMPLIRYEIGDLAIKQKYHSCSCGINLGKIDKVLGRTTENFKNVEGEMISGEYLTLTYNFVDGVVNFQIIQQALNRIEIKLVIKNGYDHIKSEKLIDDKMKGLFGKECDIKFLYLEDIPKTNTGKHLFTINNLKSKI
jgi:phenylacetate-CoA ligase